MSTFQCCHENEKHQGEMKLELRMAHTVLLLRIIIVKHTMRYWIWQLQVFDTQLGPGLPGQVL